METENLTWLQDHLNLLGLAFIFGMITWIVAWRAKFFSISRSSFPRPSPIEFKHIMGAFIVYFATNLLVPLGILYLYAEANPEVSSVSEALVLITPDQMGWISIAIFFSIWIAVILYILCLGTSMVRSLFFPGRDQLSSASSFLKGAASWTVSYPWSIVVGQVAAIILFLFLGITETEQSAMLGLKSVRPYPILFFFTIFSVIVLVPMVEEILFRGFLQSWLRRYMGRWKALSLTAILFALAHFSIAQRWGNIEIIATLLVLAFFLGFLYEKYQNLLAPIGLHMTFNAVSILLLLFQKAEN